MIISTEGEHVQILTFRNSTHRYVLNRNAWTKDISKDFYGSIIDKSPNSGTIQMPNNSRMDQWIAVYTLDTVQNKSDQARHNYTQYECMSPVSCRI